jgi:hypothetical protein
MVSRGEYNGRRRRGEADRRAWRRGRRSVVGLFEGSRRVEPFLYGDETVGRRFVIVDRLHLIKLTGDLIPR